MVGIESEQTVGLLDKLASFVGQRQHCFEGIEQHVGRDGFAEVDVPDMLSLDRLIGELVEVQVFPGLLVLAAAAGGRSSHVLRFDCDTRLLHIHEEEAARHKYRALPGAVAVGGGEFAVGVGQRDGFAREWTALLAAPAVGCGWQRFRVAVDAT